MGATHLVVVLVVEAEVVVRHQLHLHGRLADAIGQLERPPVERAHELRELAARDALRQLPGDGYDLQPVRVREVLALAALVHDVHALVVDRMHAESPPVMLVVHQRVGHKQAARAHVLHWITGGGKKLAHRPQVPPNGEGVTLVRRDCLTRRMNSLSFACEIGDGVTHIRIALCVVAGY